MKAAKLSTTQSNPREPRTNLKYSHFDVYCSISQLSIAPSIHCSMLIFNRHGLNNLNLFPWTDEATRYYIGCSRRCEQQKNWRGCCENGEKIQNAQPSDDFIVQLLCNSFCKAGKLCFVLGCFSLKLEILDHVSSHVTIQAIHLIIPCAVRLNYHIY